MSKEQNMEFPDDLKYSREHEWVLVEGSVATVGITAFAEQQLGDVVFIEMPGVGDNVIKDEAMGVVESVKAVSDVYSPISGTVIEINDDLRDNTELVNEDCYGDGWMVKIELSDPTDLDELMTSDEYETFVSEQRE